MTSITRLSLIGILLVVTTGCSSLSTKPRYEWLTGGNVAYGDRPGDVCISCGENFTFIPNRPFNALKTQEEQGEKFTY